MAKKKKGGYLNIFREDLYNPYIEKKSDRLALLARLTAEAHYGHNTYQHPVYGIDLKPGQLITTYRKLAEELPFKIAHTTIENWVKKFEEIGMLTIEPIESKNSNPPRKGTLITIVKRPDNQ